MPTYKRTGLYLAFARCSCSLLAGLALATNAMALGLGDIEGSSYLGQPLKALIDVEMGSEDYSADEIRVAQIGTVEAERLGISLVGGYQNYVLTPVMRNGRLMIDLTTREPVNEPYLNVVVELRWPEGRVFKEYSLLLDPASYRSPAQDIALQAVAGNTTDTVTADSRSASVFNQRTKATTALAGGQSYRVQVGDTLSKIAGRMADKAGRSREQLIALLLANNPRAFIAGDPHRLMAGARLYLPTDSELQESAVLPAVSIKTAPAEAASREAVIETERVTVLTPSSNTSQRFDAPDSQAAVIAQLSDRLAVTNEIIEKLRLDNESMRSRLVMLEESDYLQNLEQLLLLKDQEIDVLNQRLASTAVATQVVAQAPVKDPTIVEASPEAPQGAEPGNPVSASTAAPNIALKGLFALCILGAGFFLFRMRKTRQLLQQKAIRPASDETLLQELEDNIGAHAEIEIDSQPLADQAPTPVQTPSVQLQSIKPAITAVSDASPMCRNRRPDEEVKTSIQQKMRRYQPQLREHSGVDNYELDELIEDATAMANRGSFDVAEAILMAEYSEQSRQTGVIDAKLKRALDMIASMRNGKRAAF